MKRFLILLLLSNSINGMAPKYMPVALMPGISSDKEAPKLFKERLEKRFPGIYVTIIAPLEVGLHDGWDRIEHVRKQIKKDRTLMNSTYYNMVCHSQGTLDGRGVIETRKDDAGDDKEPHVYNYIGLSGPQAGEFGIPQAILNEFYTLLKCNNQELNHLLKDALEKDERDIYKLFYTRLAQKNISCAGYWKDPLHYEKYLQNSEFLPFLNNEKIHENTHQYKKNIMALNAMILVASLREEEIKPRQSSLFWFYKPGSDTIIEPFDVRYNAANDPLGLWELNCQRKLQFLQADCLHTQFWDNQRVFDMVAQYAGISLEGNTSNTTPVQRRGCIVQ